MKFTTQKFISLFLSLTLVILPTEVFAAKTKAHHRVTSTSKNAVNKSIPTINKYLGRDFTVLASFGHVSEQVLNMVPDLVGDHIRLGELGFRPAEFSF